MLNTSASIYLFTFYPKMLWVLLFAALIVVGLYVWYRDFSPIPLQVKDKGDDALAYYPAGIWKIDEKEMENPCLLYDFKSSPTQIIHENWGTTAFPLCLRGREYLYQKYTEICVSNVGAGMTGVCMMENGELVPAGTARDIYTNCNTEVQNNLGGIVRDCAGTACSIKLSGAYDNGIYYLSGNSYSADPRIFYAEGVKDIYFTYKPEEKEKKKAMIDDGKGNIIRFLDASLLKYLNGNLSLTDAIDLNNEGFLWMKVLTSIFGYDKIVSPDITNSNSGKNGQDTDTTIVANNPHHLLLYIGSLTREEISTIEVESNLLQFIKQGKIQYLSFIRMGGSKNYTISLRNAAELVVPSTYKTWSEVPFSLIKNDFVKRLGDVSVRYSLGIF